MASGKIKWFDNKKGFGFITEESGQDVFVHHTAVDGPGFKSFEEGDPVIFEILPTERGLKAEHVQRLHPN